MGCVYSRKPPARFYPPILFEAVRERFFEHDCHVSPGSFVPYWQMVYAIVFFFRNDEVQSIVEKNLEKITGRLFPTDHDWIIYSSQFVDFLCDMNVFHRYGVPQYPVILDYTLA